MGSRFIKRQLADYLELVLTCHRIISKNLIFIFYHIVGVPNKMMKGRCPFIRRIALSRDGKISPKLFITKFTSITTIFTSSHMTRSIGNRFSYVILVKIRR